MATRITDPVEKIIADALDAAGLQYVCGAPLDFWIPALTLNIECKQFAVDRMVSQVRDQENVVIVIGLPAARVMAQLLLAYARSTQGSR